jgi:transposase
MNNIGSIMMAARSFIPVDGQEKLLSELAISEKCDTSPAGAILIGMHILEFLGFPKYIDDILGVEHTTIAQLKDHYNKKTVLESPMMPSPGIFLSLLSADMIACPSTITPVYKFEEKAVEWHTGPLLGIEPSHLNDDRIGRVMSMLGADSENLQGVLFIMIMNAAKKAGIPLNRFILDTTLLQLDGEFKNAPKVRPGRGTDSFSQLIVSLVVASGSRMPVGFGVLAGNTSDSSTLPDVFKRLNQIADEGAIELLIDCIYPTPSNILFLQEHQHERMVYWVSPLKIGLSVNRFRELIDEAYKEGKWNPCGYRSIKESKAKIDPPLSAFETMWTLTEKIKPELEPGQKRRPKGSIKNVSIDVRCVIYRHEINAQREKENREIKKEELAQALQEYLLKLNKRKYCSLEHCENKLSELLKKYGCLKRFLKYNLSQSENGSICFSWSFDEAALVEEEKYDGTFALLTNYTSKQVNANQLVVKYRTRDQVEVDFKEMRGLLQLERILFQRPERIDTYVFLKVIALFVLTFLRAQAAQKGVKATVKDIKENMGDVLITETVILPIGMKAYSIGRDTEMNKLFREMFSLPDPVKLIKILIDTELSRIDDYVISWYESYKRARVGSG